MTDTVDTLVVGAGLAGLIAARRLQEEGQSVLVIDKGRSVGGRLATRRLDATGSAAADHGAQFFTVRDQAFADEVADWPVRVWHRGAATADSIHDDPASASSGGDGHPRYCAPGGMTAIAKHLAGGLDVTTGQRLTALRPAAHGWTAHVDGDKVAQAHTVIATPPVPQTIDLVQADLPDDIKRLAYDPCLCLLATVDGPSGLPEPGAVQFASGPANHLADNSTKDVGNQPSITLHATGPWSAAHWDDEDQATTADMLDWLRPWVTAEVTGVQLKRWRYATPTNPHQERAVNPAPGLILAGDAFGGPKVEGAALSGMAAARMVLQAT